MYIEVACAVDVSSSAHPNSAAAPMFVVSLDLAMANKLGDDRPREPRKLRASGQACPGPRLDVEEDGPHFHSPPSKAWRTRRHVPPSGASTESKLALTRGARAPSGGARAPSGGAPGLDWGRSGLDWGRPRLHRRLRAPPVEAPQPRVGAANHRLRACSRGGGAQSEGPCHCWTRVTTWGAPS